MAETYEARHALLYLGHCPSSNRSFLYEALKNANEANDDILLSDFTLEEERTHIKTPFFNDPDTGPADIWRWTHEGETRAGFIYQEHQEPLREWGYVLWDRSRLDNIGIFDSSWEPLDISSDMILERQQEAKRHFIYMASSWDARSKIYVTGGRGWWNWGDSSKVVWPCGEIPLQSPPPVRPNSLGEARESLSRMKLPSSVTAFLDQTNPTKVQND
jgi:hypothetical protein